MSCNNSCGTRPEEAKKTECRTAMPECETRRTCGINYVTIVVLYILLAIIIGSVLFY